MARDKEKKKATDKAYREANREKAKAYATAYRSANKGKTTAYNAGYRSENKEKIAAYMRLRNTGVTQEQYDGAYLKQKGVCAICSSECSRGYKLAADHCHTTGLFRGLLCSKCNTGIGLFKDDAVLVEKALNYLKETQCSQKRLIS
jgi:hypothetical protein